MIYIGIGANLPSPDFESPRATCEAAVQRLGAQGGVRVAACSRWYESAPVPVSEQPWFVNAVARLETGLSPNALLALLHDIETTFGRMRGVRNAPRVLDLDLLDYGGVVSGAGHSPSLPHPRLAERAFVLLPLADVAPDWRHPVSGLTLEALIARLPKDQVCRPVGPDLPAEHG